MALSRLENFLKNYEGNLIYVNPKDFDSTDSYDNQGNSLTRPFKTIQRALIESARFSYQSGRNNDKIDKTTILVYPGTHYVDNRPGFAIQSINNTLSVKRKTEPSTWVSSTLPELNADTNFDILDTNNDLYKFNSTNGGVILPRGTSIIGLDLRKTKVRPLYVPNPEDDTIENSSIFNVTGTCYFTAFTFFDADLTTTVFKDNTTNRYVPNFSHHKLVAFAYADGVNKVKLGNEQTSLTDLDMYYYKISEFYGQITGRALTKYPTGLDFETSPGEFTIVGQVQSNPLGISSIFSGNGVIPNSTITVTTKDFLTGEPKEHGLQQDSPILITGVTVDSTSYNGSFTVKEVVGLTTFTYTANSTPAIATPIVVDPGALDVASVILESDTVNSASPYVFNCSLRSVYGLCGMWADGSKADGFKSMVVAQFTGISLQKDENAFILYQNGTYYDNLTLEAQSIERPLHTNSNAVYKPAYQNFHIHCSNGSFIQCVSVFAIGYAKHFFAESGGDMSITNSNSNFGAVSLYSVGYRNESFDRDDVGYITHVIPPKESSPVDSTTSWLALDGDKIRTAGISTNKLYIFGQDDQNNPPLSQLGGYRIGAKDGDKLYLIVSSGFGQTTYNSPILMPVSSGTGSSARKVYTLGRKVGINSITSDVLTLTTNHQLLNGESLRIYSDTAQAPFGLSVDTVYYAITDGLNANQIRLALSYNDALSGTYISGIVNNGGIVTIVSSVSDKLPGDPGHPIAFDTNANQWYINSSVDSTNQISSVLVGGGSTTKTNDTYIVRKGEDRLVDDRIYKVRYVIPKEYLYARIPTQGFVLQESKTVGVTSISYTGDEINDPTDLRNERIIVNATADTIVNNSQVITITTELPHNFIVGDKVKIQKIISTNNPTATGITSSYNGSYYITSVPSIRTFTYIISGVLTNPGTFTNNINLRTTTLQRNSLPLVSREEYSNSYKVYKVDTVRKHISGTNGQDGVYYLTLLSSNAASSANVGYGLSTLRFSQDVRNLYPQIDRDNYNSDPYASISYADEQKTAKVITDNKRNSLTKESLNLLTKNTGVGFGITGISISGVGNTTVKVYTNVEHKLNPIKSLSFVSLGAGFPISTSVYSVGLTNSSNQEYATCHFDTTAGGTINSSTLSLLYSGSACGIGSTYVIAGGTTNAVVQVTDIVNNVGDGLEFVGFTDSELNGIFKIEKVDDRKSFTIYTPSGITSYVPNTNGYIPSAYLASKGVGITSFKFTDVSSGIVTVTTSSAHGLSIGNKVTIINSGTSVYDNSFIVSSVVGLTTFTMNVGIATTNPSSTKGRLFNRAFASKSSVYGSGQEGRATPIYAGITTTITAQITSSSTTIQVPALNGFSGFKRGDYVSVGNEVIRLASNPTNSGTTFSILRSQFGTYRETNIPVGSVIRKIIVIPSEFRRPSFIRASSHTFEYLGYGPGNYSNSLPQKQSRTLDADDVVNSQARKSNSGLIVYSGINDLGENYTGPKKTLYNGQDVVVEAPIITYTGDDASQQTGNLVNSDFDDVLVRRSLTVEGGENGNLSSQFYGPVNFTKKLTNNSIDGVEIRNLYISGLNVAQPKLINVDNSKPTTTPGSGTISLLSNPTSVDGYLGHVYTATSTGNEWRRFGLISKTADKLNFQVDKLGIGIDNSDDLTYDFVVKNNTKVNNLRILGTLSLDQTQTFNDVQFADINVSGIATVQGAFVVTGITTTKDIYVSGISTFNGNSYISGNLGIGSESPTAKLDVIGSAKVKGNLTVSNGDLYITRTDTATGDIIANGGTDGIFGIYNTTNSGSIYLTTKNSGGTPNNTITLNSSSATVNGSLNVTGNITDGGFDFALGTSDQSSRGNSGSSRALVKDNNATLVVNYNGDFTGGVYVGSFIGVGGNITATTTNTGKANSGANLLLKQLGNGDNTVTWLNDYNNANQRWYAGIDSQDSYKWKLAHPSTIIAQGLESFANDTKLSIDVSGNANLAGNFVSASIGTLNVTTTFNGAISVAQNATINGIVNINGGNGGTALQLNNGGDLVFFNAANNGSARLFCDTDNQLKTNNNILANSYIKSNSIGVTLGNSGGGKNLGWTNQYVSGGEYNFLRTDGSDGPLTTKDFVNVLGFVPQPPVATSTLPTGNSAILGDFTSLFNGSNTTFNLTIGSNAFIPLGPYNLIVVLGGVMQKPTADYIIPQSGGNYTSTIQFTTAPASGTSCFIIALGGQGSLKLNNDWTAAGQILAATGVNGATTVPIGSNGQILTVDTTLAPKVKWSSDINVSGSITGSSLSAGSGNITGGAITGSSLSAGSGNITGGAITGSSFVKSNGTSSQFLKADGSVDSNTYLTSVAPSVPSGSKVLFYQSTAPTGWTRVDDHNNKALRVVSGTGANGAGEGSSTGGNSGGTSSFTTVFASRTPSGSVSGGSVSGNVSGGSVSGNVSGGSVSISVSGNTGDTSLSESQLPSHSHGLNNHSHGVTDNGHSHSYTRYNSTEKTGSGGSLAANYYSSGSFSTDSAKTGISISGASGNTSPAGSGQGHNHSFSGSGSGNLSGASFSANVSGASFSANVSGASFSGNAMDFAVQYVDVIICRKN